MITMNINTLKSSSLKTDNILVKEIVKWAEIQIFDSVTINNEETILIIDNYSSNKRIVVNLIKMTVYSFDKSKETPIVLKDHERNYFNYLGFNKDKNYVEDILMKREFRVFKSDVKAIKNKFNEIGYRQTENENFLTMINYTSFKNPTKIIYDYNNHLLKKYEEVNVSNWVLVPLEYMEQELLYKDYPLKEGDSK